MQNKSIAIAFTPLLAGLFLIKSPTIAPTIPTAPMQSGSGWTVVAWNDLGMHCSDGDFSVFSILPPFNTLQAQLVDPNGDLVTDSTGISLNYRAVPDPTGSINTSSAGKTNFWTYAPSLFGASSTPDTGIAGHDMPGPLNTPQPMDFDSTSSTWIAEGIPLTPFDDNGHSRTYPLFEVIASDSSGNVLASTTPVLPISTELDCSACHGSGSGPDAKPAAGWVFDRSHERDHRLNILRIHDDRQLGNQVFDDALVQLGYRATGLYDTVTMDGTPILCAACHKSNALPGTGLDGISQFTTALHTSHATAIDPLNGMTLDDENNRSSCYRCHPGSETGCLRGAMGAAVASDASLAMQCQSCHGSMTSVGDASRDGWLDEPNCQSCHTGDAVLNNGQIRYTDVHELDGSTRNAVNDRFATNPDTPGPGYSLFRFSQGHGGLGCEACHGSTHAIFPASHPNDNIQSQTLQGHSGTLSECSSCHNGNPKTVTGGPHGMHPVDQNWVDDHGDEVEDNGNGQCAVCHAPDFRGSVLSRAKAARSFQIKNGASISFDQGALVTCYACHQGPNDDDPTSNRAPVAQDASITVGAVAASVTLSASDPDGNPLTYRIVQQPAFGRVGLVGNLATYDPNPGFSGTDTFLFAASDDSVEDASGTVTVTRLADSTTYGRGYGRDGGTPPVLSVDAPPKLGTSVTLSMNNVTGNPGLLLLVVSDERAKLDTNFGGLLLTELQSLILAPLGSVNGTLVYVVPNDTALIGSALQAQAVQVDISAAYRLAFSNGLTLVHGL